MEYTEELRRSRRGRWGGDLPCGEGRMAEAGFALTANRRQFVNAGHRQRSVSHGEADALGGTRADVAGGEDAGDGGFQRARLAILQRPTARSQGVDAGQDITELIARNRFGQPGTSRLGADENEGGGDGQSFAGSSLVGESPSGLNARRVTLSNRRSPCTAAISTPSCTEILGAARIRPTR